MRVAIETIGCKANRYDSVMIEDTLSEHEIVSPDQSADAYILNSCTVTSLSDSKTRNLVRKYRRFNPDAMIIITGCSAQMHPDKYASMPGVHFVIGSDHKLEIADIINNRSKPDRTQVNISRVPDAGFAKFPIKKYSEWSRAFIKIQEGCDNFCTFCIIPYARGRSRSQRPGEVIEQIETLVENGYREVVLTGIDLYSYGKGLDEDLDLVKLISKILSETTLSRLRVSSIEPSGATDRLVELAANETRICPHFHLSVQSCSDKVLTRMRRRYDLAQVEKTLNLIKEKLTNAFVGMDMLTGFPGESDEDHTSTVEFLQNSNWSALHVFPYSERDGTSAAKFKDSVSKSVREKRARELRKLSDERLKEYASGFIGKIVNVIPEKYNPVDGEYHRTISRHYLSVMVPRGSITLGEEQSVKVTGVEGALLYGVRPPVTEHWGHISL